MPSEDTQFKKGIAPGRPVGVKNKITRTVKEVVLEVFNKLQGDPKHNLLAFAKRYPRDYYQLAAKLIPSEIQNKHAGEIYHKLIIEDVIGCDPIGGETPADEGNAGIPGEPAGI